MVMKIHMYNIMPARSVVQGLSIFQNIEWSTLVEMDPDFVYLNIRQRGYLTINTRITQYPLVNPALLFFVLTFVHIRTISMRTHTFFFNCQSAHICSWAVII